MDTAPLLVFADDWARHPSSCQHLIRRLRRNTRVLWVNSIGTRQVKADSFTLRRAAEKICQWSVGLHQVAHTMWVVDVPMLPGLGLPWLRSLNRSVVSFRLRGILSKLRLVQPMVLTTLPYIAWLIQGLPRRGLIYYCTDDYSHWPGADREALLQADRDISARADLILAASVALTQSHAGHRRCVYFPHGVDVEHFAAVRDRAGDLPAAVRSLRRPHIGFFGLIYEKLDFDLLTRVARRFPDGTLVMIGPKVYCPPAFAALPNVRFLGPCPYRDLPDLLSGMDVLLLPYVNDAMIRQSSPLKLKECLASGKPTVSVDVPEARAFRPFVRIGPTAEDFVHQIEEALADGPDKAVARRQRVAGDSWEDRVRTLQALMEELSDPDDFCVRSSA